jgi:hypothetical protein
VRPHATCSAPSKTPSRSGPRREGRRREGSKPGAPPTSGTSSSCRRAKMGL